MDGVINIYKEAGYTSHDVVAKLRGILKQKKIGHTGTLDPDATGVLPVCLGKATKLCDMLTDKSKTYRTTFVLGITTDTQDISGKVLTESTPALMVNITQKQIEQTIMEFVGKSSQIPPMFSALKVNGKKLYELARAGIEVEREARNIEIYSIKIENITAATKITDVTERNLPEITMEVSCSKGTYIRTLCHDIGMKLGVGATMKQLIRTQVGRFLLKDALTLSQIETMRDTGELQEHVVLIDEMFSDYTQVYADVTEDRLLHNGNQFYGKTVAECPEYQKGVHVRVYDSDRNFIGIYEWTGSMFQPIKVFLPLQ